VSRQLEGNESAYRALLAELAEVGYISPGSVVVRHTRCGKPGCRCQGDPPQPHGPYHQWSRVLAGKTLSRRLDEHGAELYRGWIANRRRLEQIVTQMERVSADAAEILLRQEPDPEPSGHAQR
jgi:hypothetical protein